MAILDIFKKKKKPSSAKSDLATEGKEIKKSPKVKIAKKPKEEKLPFEEITKVKPKRVKEKVTGLAYRILRAPQITEKATDLAAKNQYTFKVWPRANKVEIKKAVESLYGVDVLNVKIIKIPPKRRRLGRIEGWRKGHKKAIVKIKEGQKIEVLPR